MNINTTVAKEVVADFRNIQVLVVGDMMLDVYTEGTSCRLSPEVPVPVIVGESTKTFPGGAANVVASLRALGPRVGAFGFVGDDDTGKELRRVLGELCAHVCLEYTDTTTVKHRIISNGQQVCRVDWENTADKRMDMTSEQKLDKMCEDADVIILSDYNKGCITPQVMAVLNNHRSKVVVDPKPAHKEMYHGFKLLTPNEHELFLMSPKTDVLESANALAAELHTHVVATLGNRGCVYSTGKTASMVHGIAVDVANVIGAGDVFVSVLALASASGIADNCPELWCYLANTTAAESVRHPYTRVVSSSELVHCIEDSHE